MYKREITIMTNKEKYRKFCQTEQDIPIFSKDWWLDSVCGKDNWDVVLVEKGGQIMASLPYYLTKRKSFTRIVMPKLTQTMGVYVKYPKGQKYYKRLSWEKDMMIKLAKSLPKYDSFVQSFDKLVTNWLPLYWLGFKQTVRYTYVIEDISVGDLEKGFETDIRRRRRKAYDVGVEVLESNDIEKFYEINSLTFQRRKMEIPHTFELVKRIHDACVQNSAVRMYFAKYEDNIIAVNFLVYDSNTVYYLMGGIHPDYKDLGGMDVVQFESIKFALENNKSFDFEGSMIESIEKYFRSFGAVQKPYFQISKTNSRLLKFVNFFREIVK